MPVAPYVPAAPLSGTSRIQHAVHTRPVQDYFIFRPEFPKVSVCVFYNTSIKLAKYDPPAAAAVVILLALAVRRA